MGGEGEGEGVVGCVGVGEGGRLWERRRVVGYGCEEEGDCEEGEGEVGFGCNEGERVLGKEREMERCRCGDEEGVVESENGEGEGWEDGELVCLGWVWRSVESRCRSRSMGSWGRGEGGGRRVRDREENQSLRYRR